MAALRVLILGGSRTGKSSLGNTLLGRFEFRLSRGLSAGTLTCQSTEADVHGLPIQVTDTPDLTHLDEKNAQVEAKNIVKLTSPGPHVILVVFRWKQEQGFTENDYEEYMALKRKFGKSMEQHTIIVFSWFATPGFTTEQEEMRLYEAISGAQGRLLQVLTEVDGRCIGVNSCVPAEDRNLQVTKLLLKIKGLILDRGGRFFTGQKKAWRFSRRYTKDADPDMLERFRTSRFGERENVQRVVLLGKTGSGKSSLGNTLMSLQHDQFMVARGLNSGTEKCQWKAGTVENLQLEVIDTPGLCDTHRTDKDVLQEIAKCVALAVPGPHVILIVLRCDRRFTEEEYSAYASLKKLFGDGIKKFMIIVFAGMDALADTAEEQEKVLVAQTAKNKRLQEMMKEAGDRFIGVSNTNPKLRDLHAGKLRDMMKDLVERNQGSFFSNPLYDNIQEIMLNRVQSRMTANQTSESDAEREIKQAIVNDGLDEGFLMSFLNMVRATMKRFFADLVDVSSDEAESDDEDGELGRQCSVM